MWLWAGPTDSLSLSFLICKTGQLDIDRFERSGNYFSQLAVGKSIQKGVQDARDELYCGPAHPLEGDPVAANLRASDSEGTSY